MSSGPVLIASDAHLGAVPPENARAFVRWLEQTAADASLVILNGDVFDFWFEYRSAIPRGHTRVLGALTALVDAGVPVWFMGGNHDWWGGSFLRNEIGLRVLHDPVVEDLAGYRTFLAHGDGLGKGDLGYRALRWMLRSRLTVGAFRLLHPDVGAWIARAVSQTEHRGGGPSAAERARADVLEAWALEHLDAHPDVDLVVLGHTHVPVLRPVAEGRWYANAGDWVNHRSWLELSPGRPPCLHGSAVDGAS